MIFFMYELWYEYSYEYWYSMKNFIPIFIRKFLPKFIHFYVEVRYYLVQLGCNIYNRSDRCDVSIPIQNFNSAYIPKVVIWQLYATHFDEHFNNYYKSDYEAIRSHTVNKCLLYSQLNIPDQMQYRQKQLFWFALVWDIHNDPAQRGGLERELRNIQKQLLCILVSKSFKGTCNTIFPKKLVFYLN